MEYNEESPNAGFADGDCEGVRRIICRNRCLFQN